MKRLPLLLLAVAATAAGAHDSAVGDPGDPRKAKRVVKVTMSDTMRFDPAEINVARGDTVRFVANNVGKLQHEMVIGTKKELEDHAKHMREHPGMEHSEPNMVKVAPGKTGELTWRFTRAGTFYYGCLEPGHFEAGMVGTVIAK